MSYVRELMAQVVASLLPNKLRSFLTMAGIAWGVASIVLIVAMGDGFKAGQRNNMKQLGENMVIVFNGRTEKQAGGQRAGRRIRLTYDDVRDIRSRVLDRPLRDRRVAERGQGRQPIQQRLLHRAGRGGGLPDCAHHSDRRGPLPERGRGSAEARRVCILGDNVRRQLFGERQNLLGSQVLLNGLPFRLIGLMPKKSQNSSYNGLDDDKIYVPYSTMMRDFPLTFDWFKPGMLSDLIYVPASLDDFKNARRQVMHVLGPQPPLRSGR